MKVYVSMPTIDGMVEKDCLQTIHNHLTFNHEYDLKITTNSSLITKTRNDAFGIFYNDPQYDYLLTIDSDIVSGLRFIDKEHMEGPLDRLISREKDFTVGLYARRVLTKGVPTVSGEPMDPKELIMDGRLVRMRFAGTGFMLISRHCADIMVREYPELYYEDFNLPCRWTWAMYNTMIAPDVKGIPRFHSEDFSFCQRWTDIGGNIWADTSIKLNHIGKAIFKLDHMEVQPK